MKRMSSIILSVVIFSFGYFINSATAGVVITSAQTFSGKTPMPMGPMTGKVYLDNGKMRVEMSGDKLNQTMIYRLDKKLFWMIQPDGSYTEMTDADLQKMMSGLSNAAEKMKSKMEEAMKNLPPAQRKAAEDAMMKGATQPIKFSPPIYRKIASGEPVGSWSCDHYEGSMDGVKNQDIWTVDPKTLGLQDSDLQGMKTLADYFKGMSKNQPKAASSFDIGSTDPQMYQGIPVKSIYSMKEMTIQSEVKEIVRKDLDQSLFELPANAKKIEIPAMPGLPTQ